MAKAVKDKLLAFLNANKEEYRPLFDRNKYDPTFGDMVDKIENVKNTSILSLVNMIKAMRKNALLR